MKYELIEVVEGRTIYGLPRPGKPGYHIPEMWVEPGTLCKVINGRSGDYKILTGTYEGYSFRIKFTGFKSCLKENNFREVTDKELAYFLFHGPE